MKRCRHAEITKPISTDSIGSRAVAAVLGAMLAVSTSASPLLENFDAVAARPSQQSGPGSACPQDPAFIASGWRVINNSTNAGTNTNGGTRCVTQGFGDGGLINQADAFAAHAGGTHSYAGFPYTASIFEDRSLWLVSPRVEFGEGAVLEFWTRRVDVAFDADRLQVRVMLGDGPPDVGSSASDVGAFSTLVLDINPSASVGSISCPVNGYSNPAGGTIAGYPGAWCRVRLTGVGGLPQAGSGYVAFRYYAPTAQNTSPYFAAIDTFSFEPGIIAPPSLAYSVAPGSSLLGSGGNVLGTTSSFSVAVGIGVVGGGGGEAGTTRLQCTPPGAPFSGFDQVITAIGVQSPVPNELTGACTRGDSPVVRNLQCTETRGTVPPIPINYTLSCPAAIGATTFNRLARVIRADDPLVYWRLGEVDGPALNSADGPSSVGASGDLAVYEAYPRGALGLPPTGAPADGSIGFCSSCSGNAVTDLFDVQPANASGIALETWLLFEGTPFGFSNLVGDRNVNALLQSFAFLYLTPDRRVRMHLVSHLGPGDFDFALNTIDSDVQLDEHQTYHIVATWSNDDRQIRLYVDGVEVGHSVVTGSNPTVGGSNLFNDHRFMLGYDYSEAPAVDLRLDETAIYARALTAAQVQRHYDAGSLVTDSFDD